MSARPALVAAALTATLAALTPNTTRADEGPIVTDRPTFTTTSTIVPEHMLQLETGLDIDRANDVTVLSAPTKVRFGMIDSAWIDMELQLESAIVGLDTTNSATSLASPGIGAKLNVYTSADGGVSIGTLTSYYLGVEDGADDTFVAGILSDFALPGGLALQPYAGVSRNIGTSEARTYTLAANLSRGVTDTVGVWIEGAAFWTDPNNGDPLSDPSTLADAGVAYLLDNDTQLDAWARFGLDDLGDSYGGGAGFSTRF